VVVRAHPARLSRSERGDGTSRWLLSALSATGDRRSRSELLGEGVAATLFCGEVERRAPRRRRSARLTFRPDQSLGARQIVHAVVGDVHAPHRLFHWKR
jgi:hypothetical protein